MNPLHLLFTYLNVAMFDVRSSRARVAGAQELPDGVLTSGG